MRVTGSSFQLHHENQTLSSAQLRNDALLQGFSAQASDWRNLTAMSVGSLTFSLMRFASAAFLRSSSLVGAASWSLALLGEVAAFRRTHQALAVPGQAEAWNDSRAFAATLTDFFMLKGVGHLLNGNSALVRHFSQNVGMVSGALLTEHLDFRESSNQSLLERFLQASVTNLALEAGGRLSQLATGAKLQYFERDLHTRISLSSEVISSAAFLRMRADQNSKIPDSLEEAMGNPEAFRDYLRKQLSLEGSSVRQVFRQVLKLLNHSCRLELESFLSPMTRCETDDVARSLSHFIFYEGISALRKAKEVDLQTLLSFADVLFESPSLSKQPRASLLSEIGMHGLVNSISPQVSEQARQIVARNFERFSAAEIIQFIRDIREVSWRAFSGDRVKSSHVEQTFLLYLCDIPQNDLAKTRHRLNTLAEICRTEEISSAQKKVGHEVIQAIYTWLVAKDRTIPEEIVCLEVLDTLVLPYTGRDFAYVMQSRAFVLARRVNAETAPIFFKMAVESRVLSKEWPLLFDALAANSTVNLPSLFRAALINYGEALRPRVRWFPDLIETPFPGRYTIETLKNEDQVLRRHLQGYEAFFRVLARRKTFRKQIPDCLICVEGERSGSQSGFDPRLRALGLILETLEQASLKKSPFSEKSFLKLTDHFFETADCMDPLWFQVYAMWLALPYRYKICFFESSEWVAVVGAALSHFHTLNLGVKTLDSVQYFLQEVSQDPRLPSNTQVEARRILRQSGLTPFI